MREIKFRAWDEIKKVMYHDGFNINSKGEITSTFGLYPSPKVIILQYTGLKDKNGKEIYEGDIIKAYQQKERSEITDPFEKIEVIGEVKYEPPSFFLVNRNSNLTKNWIDFTSFAEPYEIIGNIYENPKLLGRKNDKESS